VSTYFHKPGFETLLASDSGRRVASKAGRHEVQAKILKTNEGDDYLVIRSWIGSHSPDGEGWSEPSLWSHIVLDDEHNIVVHACGRRERDSWSAALKALKTKGILAFSGNGHERVFVVGRNTNRPPIFHLTRDGFVSLCNQVETPDYDFDPGTKTGWLSRRQAEEIASLCENCERAA
jgi:hypothetical protein